MIGRGIRLLLHHINAIDLSGDPAIRYLFFCFVFSDAVDLLNLSESCSRYLQSHQMIISQLAPLLNVTLELFQFPSI